MTFLELVQLTRERCGASSGATTVAAQTGESRRFVNWVRDAWNEIQESQADWLWMRKEFSFQTAANKRDYAPVVTAGEVGISDFARWHDDTFRIYRTAAGRADDQFLADWGYEQWRDAYDYGSQVALRDRPSVWAERPRDKAILLGPTPNDIYTVYGEYQSAPITLAADGDIPAMPARFHILIVYKAMRMYAAYEGAPEVEFAGKQGYDLWMSRLESDQLPELQLGESFA